MLRSFQSIFYPVLFLLTLIGFGSCTGDVTKNLKPVETAYGDLSQLIVIADKQMWDGPVGDTFQYYFSSPYLILPQPEPVFDLKHFTPEDLREDPIRTQLRNFIFLANLNDKDSPTTRMVLRDIGPGKADEANNDSKVHTSLGKDRWAKEQLIIYLYAKSEDALTRSIPQVFTAAKDRIYQADERRVYATAFQGGENRTAQDRIQERFGATMHIPKEYVLAKDDGNFFWIRKETDDMSFNLLLTKLKYSDKSQLSQNALKAVRDSLGKKYVSTRIENTYMRTNDMDLPLFLSTTTLNNRYAVVMRGVWDIVNDYMGGPFVSYAVLDEQKGEIFFVDGFIFGPGKDKRNHMRYLEVILQTIKF
jgi:hypothetical protein